MYILIIFMLVGDHKVEVQEFSTYQNCVIAREWTNDVLHKRFNTTRIGALPRSECFKK